MSKCKGCGITLQKNDAKALGYTPDLNNKLCERCFKITNYNYHENRGKELNNDEIVKEINKKNSTVFFLCDFLSLSNRVIDLFNRINGKKALVITKADILPNNIKLPLVKKRIEDIYNISDIYFVSTEKKYDLDKLINKIKTSKNVLFAGPSSSGKSTLINHLFGFELTTSYYQNTTQDFITLDYDNIKIIDAPGFIFDNMHDLKIHYAIMPRTLLLKKEYELIVNDIILSSDDDINMTLYFPKDIITKTRKKHSTQEFKKDINECTDITISNIGFIYVKNKCTLYVNNKELIDIHKSIVGGK